MEESGEEWIECEKVGIKITQALDRDRTEQALEANRSIGWRKKGIGETLSTRLQVSIIKSRDDETDRNTGLFVDGYSCNGNFMPDVFRRLGIHKVSQTTTRNY